jgi:hypothetical protein
MRKSGRVKIPKASYNFRKRFIIDNANKRYCKHTDYTKSDVAGKENLAYYSN